MGETDQKDATKMEGTGGARKKYIKWQKKQLRGDNRTLRDYKAPTPGLEKELFTVGAASDAVDFEDVRTKLARYAGVNFKQGATMAQKAIER